MWHHFGSSVFVHPIHGRLRSKRRRLRRTTATGRPQDTAIKRCRARCHAASSPKVNAIYLTDHSTYFKSRTQLYASRNELVVYATSFMANALTNCKKVTQFSRSVSSKESRQIFCIQRDHRVISPCSAGSCTRKFVPAYPWIS